MGTLKKIKKLKKIRLHHEGTSTLTVSGISLLAFNGLCFWIFNRILNMPYIF